MADHTGKNNKPKTRKLAQSKSAATVGPAKQGPPKEVSSPFSTGSGGSNFENRVQTVFVIWMLA